MDYYDVDFVRLMNRRFGEEYLFRVYLIFVSQLLLSGAYVLYPAMWWTIIQVSLITSPLVVNLWKYVHIPHFCSLTQAVLLLAEFLILEYMIFTHNIGTIIVCLIITFGLCSLLYTFTYATGKVIVLGIPPPGIIIQLSTVSVMLYFQNQFISNFCSPIKICLALYYIICHRYVEEPMLILDYINAGNKLNVNFQLILTCTIVILELFV